MRSSGSERGVYIALTALGLSAALAVFMFYGYDTVVVRKYTTQLQRVTDDLCFTVASGASPMLQRQLVSRFRGTVSRIKIDRNAGKILPNARIIGAELVAPLSPSSPKFSGVAKTFGGGGGLGEPACILDDSSDCKFWGDPTAAGLASKYPAGAFTGAEYGTVVGCELTIEFTAPISGTHQVRAYSMERLPVRLSGTDPIGVTMLVAPEMTTTSGSRFSFALPGVGSAATTQSELFLMGVDTQVTGNPIPFNVASGAMRNPLPDAVGANAGFMSMGTGTRWQTMLSSGPSAGADTQRGLIYDISNQDPAQVFGSLVPNFPALTAAERQQMTLACSNPASVARNLFSQTILELAARQGKLAALSEVAIVNPRNADGTTNKPTVVVPRGDDLLASVYQHPFVFYKTNDGISPWLTPDATNPLLTQAYSDRINEDNNRFSAEFAENVCSDVWSTVSNAWSQYVTDNTNLSNLITDYNSYKTQLTTELAKPLPPPVDAAHRDVARVVWLQSEINRLDGGDGDITDYDGTIGLQRTSTENSWNDYDAKRNTQSQACTDKVTYRNNETAYRSSKESYQLRYNQQLFVSNQLRYCHHMYSGLGTMGKFSTSNDTSRGQGWDFTDSTRNLLAGRVYRLPAYGVAQWIPADAQAQPSVTPWSFVIPNTGFETTAYSARAQLSAYPTGYLQWASYLNPWQYVAAGPNSDKSNLTAFELLGSLGTIQKCPYQASAAGSHTDLNGCTKDPGNEFTGDWLGAMNYMLDESGGSGDTNYAYAPPGYFKLDAGDPDWPFGGTPSIDPTSDSFSNTTRYIKQAANQNVAVAVLHRPPAGDICAIRNAVFDFRCAMGSPRELIVAYFPTTAADATGGAITTLFNAFDLTVPMGGCSVPSDSNPVSCNGISTTAVSFSPRVHVFSPYAEKNCKGTWKFDGTSNTCGPADEETLFRNYWRWLLDLNYNQFGNVIAQAQRIFLMEILTRQRDL